jgi:hypothetical protein
MPFKPIGLALVLALTAGPVLAIEQAQPPAPAPDCRPLNEVILKAPPGSSFKPLTDTQLLLLWDMDREYGNPLPKEIRAKAASAAAAIVPIAPQYVYIFFMDAAGCVLEHEGRDHLVIEKGIFQQKMEGAQA